MSGGGSISHFFSFFSVFNGLFFLLLLVFQFKCAGIAIRTEFQFFFQIGSILNSISISILIRFLIAIRTDEWTQTGLKEREGEE